MVGAVDQYYSEDYRFQDLMAEYNFDRFTLTANYFYLKIDSQVTMNPPVQVLPPLNVTAQNWSMQLNWHISERYEAFIRYADFDPFHKDELGVAQLVAENRRYSKEWVAGFETYLAEDLLLKTELHLFDGAAHVHWFENDLNNLETNWMLWVTQLSYRF